MKETFFTMREHFSGRRKRLRLYVILRYIFDNIASIAILIIFDIQRHAIQRVI